jgi:hypothetical protein
MQVQDYHVRRPAESVEVLQPASPGTTWMPGTRPGMTLRALCKSLNLARMGGTRAVPEASPQWAAAAGPPSFTLRKISARGIAPSASSISVQNTST